ncbi:protein Wnt-10a [Bacillus rossius redtenbacheri]|uniref:protein Wnt-10a n=1 Tax=Bacillus rossius redtenbacheri TaxID=93214 RepID=UPI002FDD3C49
MIWAVFLLSSALSTSSCSGFAAWAQPRQLVSSAVCKTFPGLSRQQLGMCRRHPDVVVAAVEGLQLAVGECRHQFRRHRWNCSALSRRSGNPLASAFLRTGFREAAFARAISAAGVAHSVARACSAGRLAACGCGDRLRRAGGGWKWGGCSHNLEYGMRVARRFLDSREPREGDIQSRVNLHNNHAGRLAVATGMQARCKCHGMSGSCELKTCWKAAPDFRAVGDALRQRYLSAVLVDQSNLGSGSPLLLGGRRQRDRRPRKRPHQRRRFRPGRRRDLALSLLYYERSPNYCERDPAVDFAGTAGRTCNRTGASSDGCASLCCGRGYNVARERRVERCQCRFQWCCTVACQNCTVEEWITVCK